ncbi:hypothetical protein M3Y98_00005900 [Aphelenchoides besseyi]|nr:hypothetical protein M3Y98_00005900 [Aphelenchoides besseyi]KAI6199383.1 hypothetical protein M3Y96_00621200 [Aphelenchoides besseyi]
MPFPNILECWFSTTAEGACCGMVVDKATLIAASLVIVFNLPTSGLLIQALFEGSLDSWNLFIVWTNLPLCIALCISAILLIHAIIVRSSRYYRPFLFIQLVACGVQVLKAVVYLFTSINYLNNLNYNYNGQKFSQHILFGFFHLFVALISYYFWVIAKRSYNLLMRSTEVKSLKVLQSDASGL